MKKIFWYSMLLFCLCVFLLAFSACGTQVRFHLNFVVDGQVYDTIDTAGREAISMPQNPTKANDEFDGWYWDEGTWERPFTANSLLDTPLSSDMSVYAKWKSDDGERVDPSAAMIVSAPAFEISGNALSLTLPNATESYSFLGQITVSAGAIWQVSTDMQGLNAIPTKTVPLNAGDNTFYLLITSENGEGITLYTVTIRRRPIYTVSFNADGGNSVTAMRAEEDSAITPPETTRTGYAFAGWDYDFTKPIKGNLTTAAKWTPNADTAYTVEYYLQNKGATGYDLAERVPLTGTTASSVTAEQKTYPHFTYKASGSTKTGTIAPDGSLVLKLYYTRDTYTVTFVGNGGTLESGNATQTVRYGNAAMTPTFARKGYTFTGWDKESNAVTENLTVTAQWSIDTYTVSYDVNGGEAIANPAAYRITDDAPLAEPTWEYGRFLGWYTASDEKISNLQGCAGDLSLTAKWECYFTLNDNTITGVSDYCKQNVTEIVIPASLNGQSIASIGAEAFYGCSGLTSVTIPDSVTSIGDGALSGCSSLASITIPFVGVCRKTASDSYQYPFGYIFGTDSYSGGVAITQYYYGSSTSSKIIATYYIPSSLKSVTVTGGEILYGAFYNCTGLTEITIPDSVTRIGGSAFYGCKGLTSVTIGNGVTSIGDYAFLRCSGLTSITIPSSVTSIGDGAFENCAGLTSFTIPNSVTSIGYYAFSGCFGLTSITVADGNTVYHSTNNCLIETTSKTLISGCNTSVIPTDGSVTSIGSAAFYNCSWLTSITIPDSVKSIGDAAFYGCSGLTSITIPDGVTSIGNYAFYGCSGLTSVTIPDGVTSIGNGAFNKCSGLTSVTIGKGVTSIGNYAFEYCSGLTSVTFKNTFVGWWYVTTKPDASSGTNVTVTNASTNATNLTSTYYSYYWYRK